jgi:hypothetical protein
MSPIKRKLVKSIKNAAISIIIAGYFKPSMWLKNGTLQIKSVALCSKKEERLCLNNI